MTVATHQPIFLPWPGFFFKALKADCMVLLDDVQYPRGSGWMNRNRLKNEKGELWLTVPVYKRGKGIQVIREVEIFNELPWRKKHLKSLKQNYMHAPYFGRYYQDIESIYEKNHQKLISLNLDFIRFLWEALSFKARILLQSDLGIKGKGTELIINICGCVGGKGYMAFPPAKKYLDLERMRENGIEVAFVNFLPRVYPQLWGNFIYNLSTLDLLLNCGPMSREILLKW